MLWGERVFKSWVTKMKYRKPCPSLIVLDQTQGSFQGKMNFPVCAIPDIQSCRCSCKGKVPPYWLNRHCNALISETTPCVFWGKDHCKSNWPLCHPIKRIFKSGKLYFLSNFDLSLHVRFSLGGGSVQCMLQGHMINGFIKLFWQQQLPASVPPGNLLASRTANAVKEPMCREITTTRTPCFPEKVAFRSSGSSSSPCQDSWRGKSGLRAGRGSLPVSTGHFPFPVLTVVHVKALRYLELQVPF